MKKNELHEATGAGVVGNYKVPLNLSPHIWKKEPLEPFSNPVSQYVSADNAYDSYDGHMSRTKEQISSLEKKAIKMAKITKKMFSQNDQDGNPINGYNPMGSTEPGTPEYIKKKAHIPKSEYENVLVKENRNLIKKILREATTTQSKGSYTSSLSFGFKDFDKHLTAPFTEFVNDYDDPLLDYDSLDGEMSYSPEFIHKREKKAERIQKSIKNNPDKVAQEGDGGLINGIPNQNTDAKPLKNFDPKKVTQMKLKENLGEDLAVWFGTKKKPKGSKQPKGPWVNICRKKEGGGHPPCGRPEATDRGYPKCRAAGVAAKMTDSQKRSACAQKRKAEKSNPKFGTGNKPKMVSYKPKNESLKQTILKVLRENF